MAKRFVCFEKHLYLQGEKMRLYQETMTIHAIPDEWELLFRHIALRDDREAFKKLFMKLFAPLCVYAQRFVTDKNSCEDIVQDVFYKLWKNRKTLDIKTSIRNFLVTGVKNSCIDYLRRQEVEYQYMQRRFDRFSGEEEEEEDVCEVAELEEALEKALSKLPENIREVFEMNRFQGFTCQQIALQRQISVKTVEAYMAKALKLLRTELKDYLSLLLFLIQ
jgi:RNA polymerase sigma-70 factor (ECF subfamily)